MEAPLSGGDSGTQRREDNHEKKRDPEIPDGRPDDLSSHRDHGPCSPRGWQREQINGIGYELNSIIVEKWEGKAYRLVIQRERRLDGEQDL